MQDLVEVLVQLLSTTLSALEMRRLCWTVIVMAYSILALALTLMMLALNVRRSVKLAISDYEEDQTSMKEEWKSALIESGAQSVMTSGEHLMLLWLADNLDTLNTVR